MLADSCPTFYSGVNELIPDYPEELISSLGPRIRSLEGPAFVSDLETDLAKIWRVVRSFCLLANLATQSELCIPAATMYGTMTAVIYRLLHMSFSVDSLDETIRLGLLAFTHHIFLQWKDICISCNGFSERYRLYLRRQSPEQSVASYVMLWLLMVAAVSVFRISEESWLQETIQKQMEECGIRTWKDMQEALKACMWIPLLDDERAKQVYEGMNRRSG